MARPTLGDALTTSKPWGTRPRVRSCQYGTGATRPRPRELDRKNSTTDMAPEACLKQTRIIQRGFVARGGQIEFRIDEFVIGITGHLLPSHFKRAWQANVGGNKACEPTSAFEEARYAGSALCGIKD